jgi:uncharacterized protein YaaQ
MKLVLTIVQAADTRKVLDALMTAGYRATRMGSSGGFLGRGNSTVLIGVDEDRLEGLLEVLRGQGHPRSEFAPPAPGAAQGMPDARRALRVDVGGPTVMVLDVGRFERLCPQGDGSS